MLELDLDLWPGNSSLGDISKESYLEKTYIYTRVHSSTVCKKKAYYLFKHTGSLLSTHYLLFSNQLYMKWIFDSHNFIWLNITTASHWVVVNIWDSGVRHLGPIPVFHTSHLCDLSHGLTFQSLQTLLCLSSLIHTLGVLQDVKAVIFVQRQCKG